MRAWNRKHKPKHWTKPKWHSQKPLEYFSLFTKSMKRCDKDMLYFHNLITYKLSRHKRTEIKHLADSRCKNNEVE